MKLQIQAHSLRLRLGEDELARLLDGHALIGHTATPLGPIAWRLALGPAAAFDGTGPADWCLHVPEAEFRAFAAERPRRDGFALAFHVADEGASALEVSVEVDVRESRRKQVADAAAP